MLAVGWMAFVGPSAYADLVTYLNFDEGAGAAVNNTGTLGSTYAATLTNATNGSNLPTWTTGKFGSALQFNGSGIDVPYVSVAGGGGLNNSSGNQTAAVTVSMWVYYPSSGGNCQEPQTYVGGSPNSEGWGTFFGRGSTSWNDMVSAVGPTTSSDATPGLVHGANQKLSVWNSAFPTYSSPYSQQSPYTASPVCGQWLNLVATINPSNNQLTTFCNGASGGSLGSFTMHNDGGVARWISEDSTIPPSPAARSPVHP
jgi:hypothetical protein